MDDFNIINYSNIIIVDPVLNFKRNASPLYNTAKFDGIIELSYMNPLGWHGTCGSIFRLAE